MVYSKQLLAAIERELEVVERRPLNVKDGQELELSSPHPLLLFMRGITSISVS